MTDTSTVGWFRTRPPAPAAHAIRRLRLLDVLRTRFDRPLTVVVGAAGHGKTTLLAQAMTENDLDPLGTDVWLCCNARDRIPEHLLTGLVSVLGGTARQTPTLEDVIDLLVLESPESIALLLDDVHELDGSPSADVLADLVDRLPGNAHLVLASRTMPAIGVRRHQSRGTAVMLAENDLRFDAAERSAVAEALGHRGDTADLPVWPALAVLAATADRTAGVEYVWDEVLSNLDEGRRGDIARLALFGVVDDRLAAAVLGRNCSAADVVGDLPLVDRIGDQVRLHALWAEALAGELIDRDRHDTLVAAARHFEGRGDLVAAARCFRDCDEVGELDRIVRSFASLPIAGGLDRTAAEELLALVSTAGVEDRLIRSIEVILYWHDSDSDEPLLALEAEAATLGDGELQSLAWWRLIQRSIDMNATGWRVDERLQRLADEGWPLARSALALVRSHAAQEAGDIASAVAYVDQLDGPDPVTRFASRASRLVALGRPEDVPVTLVEVLQSGATQAVAAQAVWMRGDIRPVDAWPIARTLPEVYARRRLADVEVPLLSIVSNVAVCAGAFAEARGLADRALGLAESAAAYNRLFAQVSDAVCVLVDEGDDAARDRLAAIVGPDLIAPWPVWPLLGALTTVRVLAPGGELLDGLDFGPSLAIAVDAGRAVAALRSGADPSAAADLAWHQRTLLEVHVPPPLLAELALAASIAGRHDAEAILSAIPGRDRWLRRLQEHPCAEIAVAADERIAGVPRRPGHDIRIRTLGELTVERSDGSSPASPTGRVAQLLALLVRERSTSRAEIVARLWPDLDQRAAGNNLRVNLSKLLDILEPERGAEGSFWLRSDGERLTLVDEGLTIDVAELDHHQIAAREAEAQGSPSAADDHYAEMRRLYTGPYLPGIDDVSVEPERMRVRSLVYAAACRRAELALARGEPEIALDHAVDAESIDPLSERAPRLQMLAQSGLGARGAALEIAARVMARLDADGLGPETETRTTIERIRRGG